MLGLVWWPGFAVQSIEPIAGIALLVFGAAQLYDYEDVPDTLGPAAAAGSPNFPARMTPWTQLPGRSS